MRVIPFVSVINLLAVSALHGAVLTNNVSFNQDPIWPFSPPPSGADTCSIQIAIPMSGYSYHEDWFYSLNGTNLVYVNPSLDLNACWYQVNYGDELSPSTLSSLDPISPLQSSLTPTHEISLSAAPDPFYLGVCLYTYSSAPYAFGWVEFSNPGNGISLLRSGMSYDNNGVYVGTLSEVPEPGTVSLAVAGLLSLLAVRRFRC